MNRFERTLRETVPTLVVFMHAGEQDAVEVKYLTEELKGKYGDRLHIVRADGSHNGEIKMKYKLEEYPTWILFKENQELMREAGNKKLSDLCDMVERAL
ncbi:MAG: hypothetical protein HDS82_02330 [Bacteroidales bacterium]|nr:hypothetical protein [Bacteroidales bacterium]